MNKRRGKALTGEFKNEVLHFGSLLSKQEGLIFFSAKIGLDTGPQCIAVVLDSFLPREDMPFSVGEYATKVNNLAERNDFFSPIIELGMAPDSKPFFISDASIGSSLKTHTFQDREKLKLFFKKLWEAFLKLEEEGIDSSYIDSRSIMVEANHPLLFPAVRFLLGTERTEICLGCSGQDNSLGVFKSLLANSLFWNRHIFGDHALLEEHLLELEEFKIKFFLDALDVVPDEYADSNAFDLDSFDEVEEQSELSEPTEIPEMTELREKISIDDLGLKKEIHVDSVLKSKVDVNNSDPKDAASTRIINWGKEFWQKAKPIVFSIISRLVECFLSLPRKAQIGVGISVIVVFLLIIVSGKTNKDLIPKDELSRNQISNHVPELVSNQIVEERVTNEPTIDANTLNTSSTNSVRNSNNIDGSEGNSTEDRADGVPNQQTKDDLNAIHSIKGPLTERQIRVLVQLGNSDDFEVRIASMKVLGEKAPRNNLEVRESLLARLSDQDYLVRGIAVGSITAYLETESVPILEAHREKEESEIVVAAIDRAIKRLETYKKRR